MGEAGRSKRWLAASSAALAASMLLGTGAADVGARPDVHLLQADDAPVLDDVELASGQFAVGDVVGAHPSVSGDGRFVVFHGAPRSEVEGEASDSRASTVYLTDRSTDETTDLISVPDGLRAGDTMFPVISGDGCTVAAVTELALDVFRDDDTAGRWDVYRKTLPHCGGIDGDWELVSTRNGSGGLARDDVAIAAPTLNRSGTLIAYTHPADHLFEADGVTTVSLVDLAVPVSDAGRSRLVAGMPGDTPNTVYTHAGIDQPVLSDDGSHLAYRSDALSDEAVPVWGVGPVEGGPATRQVYVWNLPEPDPFLAVVLISKTSDGVASAVGASEPDISRDGTVVTFTSSDTSFVDAVYPPCATECPSQVFLVDRDLDDDGDVGETETPAARLVSAIVDAEPGDGALPVAGIAPSSQSSISADGQLVAFVSKAPNLQLIQAPAIGSGDDGEILLAELHRSALVRVTTEIDGIVPTPGVHAHPDLSDTGRTTVYDTSAASELVVDGAVGGRQVVARSTKPSLAMADADLGTTLIGLESDEWYVAVINDGPATFQPAEVTIDNPQFVINTERGSTCLLGAAVPAGGSCTVALSYVPAVGGAASSTLTVSEAGFDAVSVSATISGSGGEPALRIRQAGLDFPVVTVGESSVELQLDVENIGIPSTSLGSFEITGAHASDFEFTSNNCAFRPLNARAACSVGITFTPADAGRRTALLELGTVSGQYTTAIIAGDGKYAPLVELDTAEVEAGREFLATGSQYPANTEVTVVFGDGPNSSVTAVTDDEGNFAVNVPVSSTERGGNRRIVVQTASGAAASTPVKVIESDQSFVGLPGFGLG